MKEKELKEVKMGYRKERQVKGKFPSSFQHRKDEGNLPFRRDKWGETENGGKEECTDTYIVHGK